MSELLSALLDFVAENIVSIACSFVAVLTAFLKTRKKSLGLKMFASFLDDYYTVIDGKEYNLHDLKIYRRKE